MRFLLYLFSQLFRLVLWWVFSRMKIIKSWNEKVVFESPFRLLWCKIYCTFSTRSLSKFKALQNNISLSSSRHNMHCQGKGSNQHSFTDVVQLSQRSKANHMPLPSEFWEINRLSIDFASITFLFSDYAKLHEFNGFAFVREAGFPVNRPNGCGSLLQMLCNFPWHCSWVMQEIFGDDTSELSWTI